MGHETSSNDQNDLSTKQYDHLYKKKVETTINDPAQTTVPNSGGGGMVAILDGINAKQTAND